MHTIEPPAAPAAVINTPYTHTMTATGGTGPYDFSVADGHALPGGLTIRNVGDDRGVIEGIPNGSGGGVVVVEVVDEGTGDVGLVGYAIPVHTPSGLPLRPPPSAVPPQPVAAVPEPPADPIISPPPPPPPEDAGDTEADKA